MKKDIKLITFDIDGTLINSKGEVLPETKSLIFDLKRAGFKIVLCTGRCFNGYWWIREELDLMDDDDYSINTTGAQIIQNSTGKSIRDLDLSLSDVGKIAKYHDDERINFSIHTRDILYSNEERLNDYFIRDQKLVRMPRLKYDSVEDIPEKLSRVCFMAEPEILIAFEKKHKAEIEKDFKYMRNTSYVAEILQKGTGKSEAMAYLCEYLGIDLDKVMYFGDGANDVKTLRAVGVGVAMGNARDAAKEAADYVISDNNHPSIAEFVRKYLGLDE